MGMLVLKNSVVMMSSKAIAKLTGKRHGDVIRDVRTMLDTLQKDDAKLRHLNFVEKKDARGYTSEFLLGKDLTLTLVTGYDTEARYRMVVRWQELELRLQDRQAARLEAPAMTAALQDSRAMVGKETMPHHYSNEYDMINRIVLGCTASTYRKNHEIENDEPIRDRLTGLQVAAIAELQRTNTALIAVGMEYQDRKAKLEALFVRKHAPGLISEILRLES